MTDKYEEFKEGWSRKGFTTNPFIEFEEEQAEKEKKEEIKMIISRILYCESYYYISIGQQEKVSKIYDELKEKDLIK